MKQPKDILEEAFNKANEEVKKDGGITFLAGLSEPQRSWVNAVIRHSKEQKGVVAALITSLVRKIETPSQDVRYHRRGLPGGYSGRSYDTKYITPFLKERFPQIAMKEAGWLTRSLEQAHPYTLDYPGKIRKIKQPFLLILNDVEVNKASAENFLIAIFIQLINQTIQQKKLIEIKPPIEKDIDINSIINCLETLFSLPGSSKLPVLAIHSLYEVMIREVGRYSNKILKPLRAHTSPDMRAGEIGDIEVVDANGKYFEVIEIKHLKAINIVDVKDAYDKFKTHPVKRYYLLTTAEPFIRKEEEEKIEQILSQIKKEHGCEVIINGILPAIKYYLRLLRNSYLFIEAFTNKLREELTRGVEIREDHFRTWLELLGRISKYKHQLELF